MSFWNEKEAKRLFQELPFYNTFTEKPRIKHLKNTDLLHELPFYDKLSIVKILKTFRKYARSYKIELIEVIKLINKVSSWVIESKDAEYVNISIYSQLSGSSYIELPNKLGKTVKGLINIRNNDNKCFLWCHIRHLNPLKRHAERKTKAVKKWLMILITQILNFLSLKRIIVELKRKIIFASMYFVMKIIFGLSCLCIK